MRLALTILTIVAALPAGSAMADDDCFVPMADWKPREAVAKMAADLEWTVRRIKIDDGCYEIIGTDAEGRQIEATVHPSTLEILEIEARDNDGRDGRGQEDSSDD
jgi:hypothetical protein